MGLKTYVTSVYSGKFLPLGELAFCHAGIPVITADLVGTNFFPIHVVFNMIAGFDDKSY